MRARLYKVWVVAGLALAMPAGAACADPTSPAAVAFDQEAVVCIAGCDGEPPVPVFRRVPPLTVAPAPPSKLAARSPYREVYRGIWCGERGGCVASGTVPPRNWREPIIATMVPVK